MKKSKKKVKAPAYVTKRDIAALIDKLDRIERILWECIQYTPDGTAAIEGATITEKEARELCLTPQMREFYNR